MQSGDLGARLPCPAASAVPAPAMLLPDIASELRVQTAFKTKQGDSEGLKEWMARPDPLVLDMIQRRSSQVSTQGSQAGDLLMADLLPREGVKRKDSYSTVAAVQGIRQDLPSGSNVMTRSLHGHPDQEKKKLTRAEKGKVLKPTTQ